MEPKIYIWAMMTIIIGLALLGGTSESRKRSSRRKVIRKLNPERYNAIKKANRLFWLKELGLWLVGFSAIGLLAFVLYSMEGG